MSTLEEGQYLFGPFCLNLAQRLLSCEGRPIRLTAKVFDLLLLLVQNHTRLLRRGEIIEALWPDTVVEEGNLSVLVSTLRKALEDSAAAPRYIETLPRFGYRFIGVARHELVPRLGRPPDTSQVPAAVALPAAPLVSPLSEPGAALFVGREPELRRLHELYAAAERGAGRLVFVHGDAGLGKTTLSTRLLNEISVDGSLRFVATGRCLQQHGSGEAYLPVRDAFAQLLAGPHAAAVRPILRQCAPAWCLHFPNLFGTEDDLEALSRSVPAGSTKRLLGEAADALAALSQLAPVVIVLEDLHWADPSSVDLIGLLGQRSAGCRWLLIGTFRSVEVDVQHHVLGTLLSELRIHQSCDEIALRPLSDELVDTYLVRRFGEHALPDALAALLKARARGHPLVLTRVVQWLVDRGHIQRTSGTWRLTCPASELVIDVPHSVESMISRRLDLLTVAEYRTLSYASVEGDEFTSTVLATVLEEDEVSLEERLHALDRVHHLIEFLGEDVWPSGARFARYRFGHALYREALYGGLVVGRRRQLHGSVAQVLEQRHAERVGEVSAQLAVHLEASGQFARAVEFLARASENARRVYAYREAEAHCDRALELAAQLPAPEGQRHTCALLLARAWLRHLQSHFAQGAVDFEAMRVLARELGDAGSECEAVHGRWVVALFSGDRQGCEEHAGELLRLAELHGDERRRVLALGMLGAGQLAFQEEIEGGLQRIEEALALGQQLGAEQVIIPTLQIRGLLGGLKSNYEAALQDHSEVVRQCLAARRDANLVVVSEYHSGFAHGNLGQISKALSAFDAARDLAERAQFFHTLGRIENGRGWVHTEIENWPEAERHNQQALELSQRYHDSHGQLHALLNLALAATRQGRGSEAAAYLPRVAAIGDLIEIGCGRRKARLRTLQVLSELDHALGDLDAAEAHARQLQLVALQFGATKYLALGQLQLARVHAARGQTHESESCLANALQALEQHPCPLLEWHLHAEMGQLKARLGHVPAAERAFAQASAGADRIAGGIDDPLLRQGFVSSAAVLRARAGAPSRDLRTLEEAGQSRAASRSAH